MIPTRLIATRIGSDAAVTLGRQEKHLVLERVRTKRPAMAEDNGLACASVWQDHQTRPPIDIGLSDRVARRKRAGTVRIRTRPQTRPTAKNPVPWIPSRQQHFSQTIPARLPDAEGIRPFTANLGRDDLIKTKITRQGVIEVKTIEANDGCGPSPEVSPAFAPQWLWTLKK